jgi:hypothetical protein
MATEEDAGKLFGDLNGTSFMERTIVVNEARPQQPRERGGYGGDRGRGAGYGRGKINHFW